MTAADFLIAWCALSVPVSVLAGMALRGRAEAYPLADVAGAPTGAPSPRAGASTGSTGTPPPQGLDTHR